jgi:hypothetical protein
MKDKLNKLWNVFPQNPTQTKYLRFLKGPDSEIKTQFTESVSNFNKKKKDLFLTKYSKFIRGFDD